MLPHDHVKFKFSGGHLFCIKTETVRTEILSAGRHQLFRYTKNLSSATTTNMTMKNSKAHFRSTRFFQGTFSLFGGSKPSFMTAPPSLGSFSE